MASIRHRIGISNTTVEAVYNSVATKKGLSKWWTTTIEGESKLGHVLNFLFSNGGPSFKVLKLEPYSEVLWECVSGPDEWLGTYIRFDIYENNGEIILLFEHCDWKDEVEFMSHCSTQWAYFLIELKNELSSIGKAKPYGSDSFIPISNWSK